MRYLLALWCLIGVVNAANADEDLRGINGFGLFVGNLDDDAKKCGITKATIETSIRFILQQSKIKLQDGSSHVIATDMVVLDNCAFSWRLELWAPVTITPNKRTTIAPIWLTGGISTGPQASADQRAGRAFEAGSKRLVSAWSQGNP